LEDLLGSVGLIDSNVSELGSLEHCQWDGGTMGEVLPVGGTVVGTRCWGGGSGEGWFVKCHECML